MRENGRFCNNRRLAFPGALSLLIAFFLLIFSYAGGWTETVGSGEALTLERAVELGLKNHPSIMAGISTVKVNEARIGEARANYYPQVSLTENYSRVSPATSRNTSVTSATGLPSGTTVTSVGGPSDQYTSSANLTQMLYDFGKTSSQVKVQRLTTDSTRSDLENLRDQVVVNVKQAYFTLLQAERNRDVMKETVRQFQEHLRQAQGFYRAGTKPKFDVTKAEVDLSGARVNLIKVENQVLIGRVTLNNAMGLPDAPPDYKLADSLAFEKYDLSYEEAVQKAYRQRPDLLSVAKKLEAAKESINLSQKGYYPVLSGVASYYYAGTNLGALDNGWSFGASMSIPLFSGFLTKYQVLEAVSARDVLSANELSLRQDILLQVQQAYLSLRDAGERIGAAEIGVRQGKENLDLANGRYQAGVGNPIEVTDSVVALVNAQILYTQALYDYRVAVANIEKAMGATR